MVRSAAAVAVSVATLIAAPGVAAAQPVAPQPGAQCSPDFADVMTWPPSDKMPLVCVDAAWTNSATPYPVSDRWFSYGPPMELHGEGLRNPSITSGEWTAVPQDPETRCRAEQLVAVPGTTDMQPPQVAEGAAGQPLSLLVLPKLYSIQMSGNCLWTRDAP